MSRHRNRCQHVTVEVDGEPTTVRIQGSGDMSDEGRAALAEIIAATKRSFAEMPPFPDVCPDCGTRTSAPGHAFLHRLWERKHGGAT